MGYMDNDERQALGRQVENARVTAGLSKEGAARDASMSSITWNKIETGQNVLDVKLASALRVVGLTRPTTTATAPDLHEIDDDLLLAEIARRFARGATRETGSTEIKPRRGISTHGSSLKEPNPRPGSVGRDSDQSR